MKISPPWLSAEFQARIEPPPIPLTKKQPGGVKYYDIIKIKIRRNPANAASERYELKIITFEHGQPEEFLQLMKNFKKAVDRTGTTAVSGEINYLRTMLLGKALW